MKIVFALLLIILAVIHAEEEETEAVQIDLAENDNDITYSEVDDQEESTTVYLFESSTEDAGSSEDSTADELSTDLLETELEELSFINDQTESFEVVEIDGDEYTKEELEQLISETEQELEQIALEDAALDVSILFGTRDEQGNVIDYTEAMDTAEYLLGLMDEEDEVEIDGVTMDKNDIELLMLQAETNMADALLLNSVEELSTLVVEETEDYYEAYKKNLEEIRSFALNLIENSDLLLDDMDGLNDVDEEAADVEEQFLKENVNTDDITDENEEIDELLEVMQETVEILDQEYDSQELQDIQLANNEEIRDLKAQEMADKISFVYDDKTSELRLDQDDFDQGLMYIEDLIGLMDDDSIVIIDGDEFSKFELDMLYDNAQRLSSSQYLNSVVVKAEENLLSDPPTSLELENEIEILNDILGRMQVYSTCTIDGVEYTYMDLEIYKAELEIVLKHTINDEKLSNELEDIKYLLDLFEMTVSVEDLNLLSEELKELQAELSDGDILKTDDDEVIDKDIIQIMIGDTNSLMGTMDSGEVVELESDFSVLKLLTADLV